MINGYRSPSETTFLLKALQTGIPICVLCETHCQSPNMHTAGRNVRAEVHFYVHLYLINLNNCESRIINRFILVKFFKLKKISNMNRYIMFN